MASPEISVVIPTTGREARLASAIEALAEQTLEPARFEVVVVRDSHSAPPPPSPSALNARFLARPPGTGAAGARNLGWRAAAAPLIAFTDDDCRPTPHWLESLLEETGDAAAFFQGRTEPDPDERHLIGGLARSQTVIGPSVWYPTCNMAYPRALLERLDGFDERFFFGGEDTDLALRAKEAGAKRIYVDRALVWHAVHPRSLSQALSLARAWSFLPALLKRHPGQRQALLHYGLFWKRAHAWLLLAAVAAVAGRRNRTLAVAGSLPYLSHRARPFVRRHGVGPRALAAFCVRVPLQLPVDVTELAVTIREAIRHRVPVA